jgi:5'-nucleotidase
LLISSLGAMAQPAAKIARIGWLTPEVLEVHTRAFREAMRALHMDVSSVGNHEFDKGADDLLRRQTTAGFQYLAANVVRGDAAGRATILPATAIRTIGGVRIGFIGETLEGTPQIVAAGGIKGLTFQDEASTANAYAAGLGCCCRR